MVMSKTGPGIHRDRALGLCFGYFLFNDATTARFSTAHTAMDDGKESRRHRGIRSMARDA